MANHNCTYCQNPITTCRIHCEECTDFDLCLQCFACGVEAGPHRKEHDYRVLEDGSLLTIFNNEGAWAAHEEEMLLDSVEQYGFGNWTDVSNYVKTKSSEECEQHFQTFFMQGNIGKATFQPTDLTINIIDHTCPEGGPLSPSLSAVLPPIELTIPEQQELGYMPLRDDFEREYDNEGETLVSSLSINYDDDELDIAFKLAQADIYRQRLKERARRKKIARDYSIIQNSTTVGIKRTQTNKKKISRDEKEFQEKMRIFAQFHTPSEQEKFFESLQKEKRLKSRIKELMRYRRNGITKMDECGDYEKDRALREKKKELKKKQMASSSSVKRTVTASKKESDVDVAGITIGDKRSKGAREIHAVRCFSLLSTQEKKLCHSIGMKPASYITIKTCIIKDYLQRQQGLQVKIRYPSHMDKTHRRRILNYLRDSGWISGIGTY